MKKTLRDFMTPAQRAAMTLPNGVSIPTWHSVCFDKTGVSRPGKTARDRAKLIRRQSRLKMNRFKRLAVWNY